MNLYYEKRAEQCGSRLLNSVATADIKLKPDEREFVRMLFCAAYNEGAKDTKSLTKVEFPSKAPPRDFSKGDVFFFWINMVGAVVTFFTGSFLWMGIGFGLGVLTAELVDHAT